MNTISKLQLVDKYEMFNPTFEGYTFSSSTHRILMNIGHILSYKVQLNKFQGTAIIQNIHSDCPKRVSTIPIPPHRHQKSTASHASGFAITISLGFYHLFLHFFLCHYSIHLLFHCWSLCYSHVDIHSYSFPMQCLVLS